MDSTGYVAVLDTDIGSDVDDVLALALMARSPELNLIGVTTVYGDTMLRARMARFVCNQLGRPDVAIAAGERETLAGRPVWWAGHEGHGIPNLDQVEIDTSQDGVTLLLEAARTHGGNLDIFAIGPLTNLARAIEADPSFSPAVHHLYIMGGAFWRAGAEHNIKCDPEAAAVVFRSGIPMTVCGLDVTTKVWLREPDVVAIESALGELGSILAGQIRHWWAFKASTQPSTTDSGETFANNPHDPLAVLAAIRPELFRFEQCDVEVELGEEMPGRTKPVNCGAGSARLAAEVDVEAAERDMVQRMTGQYSRS